MSKAQSMAKTVNKGKSMPSIHPYEESRTTNKSNDLHKIQKFNSKMSKVSKVNSSVKLHQPLSIQNRGQLKQSKLQASNALQSQPAFSRKQIQSQLQSKASSRLQKPMSFKQTKSKEQTKLKEQSLKLRASKVASKQTIRNDQKLKSQNEFLTNQNSELKQKIYRLQESSLQDKQKIKALITRISEIKRETKFLENPNQSICKNKITASYAHIIKTRAQTDRQNIQQLNFKNLQKSNIDHCQQQTPFRILQPITSQSKYSRQKPQCSSFQCEERRKYLQGELYRQRIKRDQLQDEKKQWQRNKDQLKRQYQQLLEQIQHMKNQCDYED